MEWILENKTWLFEGLGVLILGGIGKLIYDHFYGEKKSNKEDIIKNKNEITINNQINNNPIDNLTPKSAHSTKDELEKRKKITNILFVDDDTKFKIIKILHTSGWINTKITKDIENADSEQVKNTHIFFIDINGVGIKLGFKDEGLGLANYLKKKYPSKKVIIYSTDSSGNRFHEALRNVDDFLNKNAEPAEFTEIIEQFSAELDL